MCDERGKLYLYVIHRFRHYSRAEEKDLPDILKQCLQFLQCEPLFLTLSNLTGLRLHELAPPDSDSETGETSSQEERTISTVMEEENEEEDEGEGQENGEEEAEKEAAPEPSTPKKRRRINSEGGASPRGNKEGEAENKGI